MFQVKASAPKLDKNGYFFYVTATAKKKKISLMQSKPPRVAFAEDAKAPRRGLGVAQSSPCGCETAGSSKRYAVESTPMSQRASPPAPRARLTSQLECYQPRYHTIREREPDRRVQVSQDYVDYHRVPRSHPKKHPGKPENTKTLHVGLAQQPTPNIRSVFH